jgi:hypothetical protein
VLQGAGYFVVDSRTIQTKKLGEYMFLPRHKCFLLALITASVLALEATPALAYVNGIASGLLPASAAPSGFLAPKDQIFLRFHSDMSVKTGSGKAPSPACISQKSFANYGWKQGMIETFPPQQVKPFRQLTLCAWRFKSVGGAQKAYSLVANPVEADLKPKRTPKKSSKKKSTRHGTGTVANRSKSTLMLLASSRIGDESLAVRGGASSVGYGLYFRHANALIEFNYSGPPSFSSSSFLTLGRTINSKLR